MNEKSVETNAEELADAAQARISECLTLQKSFLVQAGAGAGKTESLVKALRSLQVTAPGSLPRGQRIACITYTNIAKREIRERIGDDPRFFIATIHEFFWSVLQPFQSEMRMSLDVHRFEKALTKAGLGGISDQRVEYSRGYRRVSESVISLDHDDVPSLAASLLARPKFATLLKSLYPIVLIDEYQDTDKSLADAILEHCIGPAVGPVFGLFGDDWQQIHPRTVGLVSHENLEVIPKATNFRSGGPIVNVLNAMRPSLPQALPSRKGEGATLVFHTDSWQTGRVAGSQMQGDLDAEFVDLALRQVRDSLVIDGWDLSPDRTRTLILTHKAIAARQGYPEIARILKHNDDFAKLEHPVIRFLVENVEQARTLFSAGNVGRAFEALGMRRPYVHSSTEKAHLSALLRSVEEAAQTGTIGSMLSIFYTEPLSLPGDVQRRLAEVTELGDGNERSQSEDELEQLLNVRFDEIIALRDFISHHSPYETKHGVKGAQFENVVVLLGGGWNHYNFPRFLAYAADPSRIPKKDQAGYMRARNLFYVCASRPEKNLALLFTQELSAEAHQVLNSWFGAHNVRSLAAPSA